MRYHTIGTQAAVFLLLGFFALTPVSADTMKKDSSGMMHKESMMDAGSGQAKMGQMDNKMMKDDAKMMHKGMQDPKMDGMKGSAEMPMKKSMN